MSRTISARIPEDLYVRLRARADSEGVSVSEVLTRAVHTYLQTRVSNGDVAERLNSLEARLAALERAFNSKMRHLEEKSPTVLPQTTVNNQSTGVNRESDLAVLTVRDLRRIAKGRGVPQYWLLSKSALVAALQSSLDCS